MGSNFSAPDPKKRFSDRVEDYIKFRPSYPQELILFLKENEILNETSVVADIGSGTGILTRLLLENGNTVYGIEPNTEMRQAAENHLKNYTNFISVNGSSERTTITDHSIDLITAAQAYHWFDKELTKKEFKRILKPSNNENIVLIWNTRTNSSIFNKELEDFIKKFSTDYEKVSHTQDLKKNENLFFDALFKKKSFVNHQNLTFEGLQGRLLSSSYMLKKTDKKYPIFEMELMDLFNKHQKGGKIMLDYETEVYYGSV